jgi:hypothetical protein
LSEFGNCAICALNYLIEEKSAVHHQCQAHCHSINHLLNDESAFSSFRGYQFVVATKIFSKPWIKNASRQNKHAINFKERTFSFLYVLGEKSVFSTRKRIILLLSHDKENSLIIGTCDKRVEPAILHQYIRRDSNLLSNMRLTDYAEPSKVKTKCAQKKNLSLTKEKTNDEVFARDCDGCQNWREFEENIKPSPKQTLISNEISLFDALKVLNLDCLENRQKISRACELSISSYDVESFTEDLENAEDFKYVNNLLKSAPIGHDQGPRQCIARQKPLMIGYTDEILANDVRIFSLDPNKESDSIPRMIGEFVDFLIERQEVLSREKSSLLGFMLSILDDYERAHYLFYEQLSPYLSEESTRDLREQWRRLMRTADSSAFPDLPTSAPSRSESEALAINVIQAIFPEAESVLSFHKSQNATDGRTPKQFYKDIKKSWEFSLLGKIQKQATNLINNQFVFAFNGENYDNVLLLNYICIACKERNIPKIYIQKEGSKIKRITIKNQIHFAEARKLCSPNCSLDGLGKMCELEVSKMSFPFKTLTSPKVLLNPKLSTDINDWKTELTSAKKFVLNPHNPYEITELNLNDNLFDTIRKANSVFEEKRLSTIDQFIKIYLEKDVLILQQCLIKINREYTEILKASFIELKKITISSFSYTAALLNIMRKKRVGLFSLNDPRMYSIFKRGTRGGLTTVYRTIAGKHADYSLHLKQHLKNTKTISSSEELDETERYLKRNNSHLLSDPAPSNYVIATDISSLYGASGMRDVICII